MDKKGSMLSRRQAMKHDLKRERESNDKVKGLSRPALHRDPDWKKSFMKENQPTFFAFEKSACRKRECL